MIQLPVSEPRSDTSPVYRRNARYFGINTSEQAPGAGFFANKFLVVCISGQQRQFSDLQYNSSAHLRFRGSRWRCPQNLIFGLGP